MKILFIDDEFGRVPVAKEFYEMHFDVTEFKHITYVPKKFGDYDIISFDNDLGGHLNNDTFIKLSRMLWQGELHLEGKKVFVHSMNSVAAQKVCEICLDAGASLAQRIPFTVMIKETAYR